jgi:uncharacterized membrane protein
MVQGSSVDEKIKRSLVKTITYKIVMTIFLFVISFLITTETDKSLNIAILYNILSVFIYFSHERAWNKIRWGKN